MIYQRHLQTQSRRGIFAKTRFLCTSRKYVTHEKMVVYNIHVCFVFKKQSLNIFKIMLMLGRCVLSIPKLVTCTKKIADTRVKLSHNMLICFLSRILLIKSFLWMWMLLIPMGISYCSHCRPLLETAPFCIVMKLTNPLTERKDRPGKRYCKTDVFTWEQYFYAMPCKR